MHRDLLKVFLWGIMLSASTSVGQPACADNEKYSGFDRLNNIRSDMSSMGIEYGISYTWDFSKNVAGGLKRSGTNLRNLDVTLSVDTGAVGLWPDGEFFLYVLENSGGDKLSAEIAGDAQTVSNIEAPRTTRLYELWYEHHISDALSVLAGFHDYNSEFNVLQSAGLFLNSSFGIQPDISAGGRPSVFPLAGLGVRIQYAPAPDQEYLFAVYDGDPGDPDEQEHFGRADWDGSGGTLYAFEAAYPFATENLPGQVKVGLWHNSGEFSDIVSNQPRDGNTGGYIIAEKQVFREEDIRQGLTVFLQFGANDPDVNEIHMYAGGGVAYRGLIVGRDADEIGLAVAHARINSDLTGPGALEESETTVEWTYSYQVNDHLRFQPDIQYIRNPGALTARDDAIVLSIRVELSI